MHIDDTESKSRLREVCLVSMKLGLTGFGGIAGMVAVMEDELVNKKKWIDHQHFMDVVSVANIVPGPNAVEIMMHCGKHRAGKWGLIGAGFCYILPASMICMLFALLYARFGRLPAIQSLFFGIRPAVTALVCGTVFRLSRAAFRNNFPLLLLAIFVFAAARTGINEIALILVAGLLNYLYRYGKRAFLLPALPLLSIPAQNVPYTDGKLFIIFLKIGSILYGSGLVLFGYMNSAFVEENHWLTRQELIDTIAVGQITPGPILSSATFAGYLISGPTGAIIATAGIFLPSFFISFFLHKALSSIRNNEKVRAFLDGLNAASISIIAIVGYQLFGTSIESLKSSIILLLCLGYSVFAKKINAGTMIIAGSIMGVILLWI